MRSITSTTGSHRVESPQRPVPIEDALVRRSDVTAVVLARRRWTEAAIGPSDEPTPHEYSCSATRANSVERVGDELGAAGLDVVRSNVGEVFSRTDALVTSHSTSDEARTAFSELFDQLRDDDLTPRADPAHVAARVTAGL